MNFREFLNETASPTTIKKRMKTVGFNISKKKGKIVVGYKDVLIDQFSVSGSFVTSDNVGSRSRVSDEKDLWGFIWNRMSDQLKQSGSVDLDLISSMYRYVFFDEPLMV